MGTQDLLATIREDRIHGATELALIALNGISLLVQQPDIDEAAALRREVFELIAALQQSRPSMTSLQNLLQRVVDELEEFYAEDVQWYRSAIAKRCDEVVRFARRAQSRAVENMVALIQPDDVIMTHSISSTVKQIGEKLTVGKPSVRFIVTESRPGNEGGMLAAYLAGLGLPATYITEAQIDLHMPQASKVVIGADTVLADGSVINKCGSTLMALSARYHGIPFYVCAESFKRNDDNDYELEQMDSRELGLDVPGVEVSNIYFERVPEELITRWVY